MLCRPPHMPTRRARFDEGALPKGRHPAFRKGERGEHASPLGKGRSSKAWWLCACAMGQGIAYTPHHKTTPGTPNSPCPFGAGGAVSGALARVSRAVGRVAYETFSQAGERRLRHALVD